MPDHAVVSRNDLHKRPGFFADCAAKKWPFWQPILPRSPRNKRDQLSAVSDQLAVSFWISPVSMRLTSTTRWSACSQAFIFRNQLVVVLFSISG